jgi:WD40-like Beta Propeller Repeat
MSSSRYISLVLAALGALITLEGSAQFYNGSDQEYGKNRVQYQDFLWQYYRFPELETYFYKGGKDVARYVSISAHRNKREMEKFFDFTVDDRIQFVVYNSLGDFRQSNIGVTGDDLYNIGGVTRIVGTKVFVYNEGDHRLLDRQVRSGIAQLMIDQMMYGGNWREVLRNSTLLNLPSWYTQGLVAYCAGPWDARSEARIRDGVLSDRFKRFNRLEGEDAVLAGQAVWTYVAETYGASVIPNILYMTRVSRNPESGFTYVLGMGLKTLTQESLDHYRKRYEEDDRLRAVPKMEEMAVKTRRTRSYSEFKLSPDGRYAAWVSNDQGQYKVWLYDRAEKKAKRLLKGEKRLNRIIDKSFPILAWHPSGRALTWTSERKGELFLTTYTLDDEVFTRKPVFMLEKILSMDYSADGQNMIFSGVREGRTDLYLYYPIGNRQEQLTDDQYDDMDPAFVDGGRAILFSSDRVDDTLRSNAEVVWTDQRRDIFRYDLTTRSTILARMTNTPDQDETEPMGWDSANYAFLSTAGRVSDRWLLHFDSAITAIDTAVHYRYFTTEARATNLKRGIAEHDVVLKRGWHSQLVYANGKYHFYTGHTGDGTASSGSLGSEDVAVRKETITGNTITDDMSLVVKVDRGPAPDSSADAVDIHNYRFLGEEALPRSTNSVAVVGASSSPLEGVPGKSSVDSLLITRLAFPEQRNYNVNFATDQVLTQLSNQYDGRFYQPLTNSDALNPGLSGLTRMAMSDLFEDRKIVGGFRLALDLNNNHYLLKFQDLRRRVDKEITLQRQGNQLFFDQAVVKVHTHQAQYRLSYPFSELASLRATLMYRHDRLVVQSTDNPTLGLPNSSDQTAGAKLEYVYDSSLPRGLNLWTGWKLKAFAEYYVQPDGDKTNMQVLGVDLRHSLRVHRDIIWVTRLAGSSSLGSRKVLFVLGGVDNWLFPKVNTESPVDGTQNYFYQSLALPVRGFFYNTRNGNSFGVFNTELRIPIFRYLMNKPIRSDFVQNFQIVGFGDIGAAWTGSDPYAESNSFNTRVINQGPLTISIKNQREPIVGGYGFGLRSRLLGYFVRADWAWGVEDGRVLPNVFHFSLALDI